MKENAYFDNAATTWPKPEAVYAFMDSFFRSHGVNPGRSGSQLAAEAEAMIVETRTMLAQCFGFGGPSSRVVFTLNGTDALNQAINGLIGPGEHIVTTRLEHNAVLRSINHLVRDSQVSVSRVGADAQGYIDPADIRSAINKKTRAIVLNHASNVIGTVQPLADIAELARSAGVPLVVDAAQTAGVVPIDMDNTGIGVLTFPGHKGLFGPMGVGGMIVAESLDIHPQRFGGTGVDSLSEYQPDTYPYRLEAGTVPLPGIAGLHAAQCWFRELGAQIRCLSDSADVEARDAAGNTKPVPVAKPSSHGVLCKQAFEHIHGIEMAHLMRIESKLREFESVRILGNARPDARVATLSFTSKNIPTEQIADRLDADHHICARAGLQCAPLVHVDAATVDGGGTVRLSPGYFTDEQDMLQLFAALDDILG